MYLPNQFDPMDVQVAAQVMRSHPFASLISVDEGGLPCVTHLPLHLEIAPGQDGALGAPHLARSLRTGQSPLEIP